MRAPPPHGTVLFSIRTADFVLPSFLTRIFHIQGYLFFLTFLIMPEFSYLVSSGSSSHFAA